VSSTAFILLAFLAYFIKDELLSNYVNNLLQILAYTVALASLVMLNYQIKQSITDLEKTINGILTSSRFEIADAVISRVSRIIRFSDSTLVMYNLSITTIDEQNPQERLLTYKLKQTLPRAYDCYVSFVDTFNKLVQANQEVEKCSYLIQNIRTISAGEEMMNTFFFKKQQVIDIEVEKSNFEETVVLMGFNRESAKKLIGSLFRKTTLGRDTLELKTKLLETIGNEIEEFVSV